MPAWGDLKNRIRIAGIAVTSVAAAAGIAAISGARSEIEAWSIGSAYAGFTLLAVSLSLGPINVLRKRHNPAHSVLRRDFGIGAGVAGLVHTALGIQVHMGGEIIRYFTLPEPRRASGMVFVSANYLGLIASVVLVLLVSISNNVSIRKMGIERWKKTQRLVYAAAAATLLHGLLYQLLEKRGAPGVSLVLLALLVVLVLQVRGVRVRRRRGA